MADFAQQTDESDAEWLARLDGASRTELPGEERFAAFCYEQVVRRRVHRGWCEAQACEQAEAEARDRAVANGTQRTAELTLLEQPKEACRRLEAEARLQLILRVSQVAPGAQGDTVLAVRHEPN